jgi:hypothetical protein
VRELLVPPSAPAMLGSLRAIGYSFEAALADIVDNSVAADASTVDIQFRTRPSPYVAILDDGHGMSPDALIEAMRHGGVGPDQERSPSDLGRFGLGLKTASLSQCRRLVLVTRAEGVTSGAVWDLDRVEATKQWMLGILGPEEISLIPHADELDRIGRGTLVLWEKFDRALAGETSPDRALGELMDRGRGHLGLMFHRYLSGQEPETRLRMAINNLTVAPTDPFLTSHRSTTKLPPESMKVEGATVAFQAYVLPHLSKMTREDLALAGGEEGLRRHQGFYVYRNRRLITYGTWFRLIRQEELTKLARVQVDIPNTLDHLWALDVKKSTAYPPEAIRTGLLRVIERIAGTSRHVYQFRGRRTVGALTYAWDRVAVRGGFNYTINRSHPAVVLLRDCLDNGNATRLEQLLRTIEVSLPVDSVYADMASERTVQATPEESEVEELLRDLALRIVQALGTDGQAVDAALEGLIRVEPFSHHAATAKAVIESIRHDRQ